MIAFDWMFLPVWMIGLVLMSVFDGVLLKGNALNGPGTLNSFQ
jgi:hypothetical protein